ESKELCFLHGNKGVFLVHVAGRQLPPVAVGRKRPALSDEQARVRRQNFVVVEARQSSALFPPAGTSEARARVIKINSGEGFVETRRSVVHQQHGIDRGERRAAQDGAAFHVALGAWREVGRPSEGHVVALRLVGG